MSACGQWWRSSTAGQRCSSSTSVPSRRCGPMRSSSGSPQRASTRSTTGSCVDTSTPHSLPCSHWCRAGTSPVTLFASGRRGGELRGADSGSARCTGDRNRQQPQPRLSAPARGRSGELRCGTRRAGAGAGAGRRRRRCRPRRRCGAGDVPVAGQGRPPAGLGHRRRGCAATWRPVPVRPSRCRRPRRTGAADRRARGPGPHRPAVSARRRSRRGGVRRARPRPRQGRARRRLTCRTMTCRSMTCRSMTRRGSAGCCRARVSASDSPPAERSASMTSTHSAGPTGTPASIGGDTAADDVSAGQGKTVPPAGYTLADVPGPLGAAELKLLDAWWRAANYLAVGQIYLMANPLLREPLAAEHVKPRLLGHWGTTPGLNLLYTHANRVIRARDLDAVYVMGPGHGGPGPNACAWLEGTYSELYSSIDRDARGMARLFRQFSFPGGVPSHCAPETPGSFHEGGELGYSLLHAYGAALDHPDLVVFCVVGDGEAETGPLAASWHANKFVNPACDGAVVPVLHLNSYKIANPTVLARIPEAELLELLRGYGYDPYVVSADLTTNPAEVHQALAGTLDRCLDRIAAIQHGARAVLDGQA